MMVFRAWRTFLVALLVTLGLSGMTKAAPLFPGLFPDALVNFGPRPAVNYSGSWIGVPMVTSMSFDPGGGGYGITSGYTGTYTNSLGEVKTADVWLTSTVMPNGMPPRKGFDYKWTISNKGNGDFIKYFGPKPPKFLMGILKPGETQMDTLLERGPPRLAQWGGRWNPEVGDEAPELQPSPIPLPASVFLLAGALGLLVARKRA